MALSPPRCTVLIVFKSLSTMVSVTSMSPSARIGAAVGGTLEDDGSSGSWVGLGDGENVSPGRVGTVVAGAADGLEDGLADGVRVGPAVGFSDGAVIGPRLGENAAPDRVGAVGAGAMDGKVVGPSVGVAVKQGGCSSPGSVRKSRC